MYMKRNSFISTIFNFQTSLVIILIHYTLVLISLIWRIQTSLRN